MPIKIEFTGSNTLGSNDYITHANTKIYYPCFSQVSCAPYLITFSPGSYLVKLYGASGGSSGDGKGGRGGYVSGQIKFPVLTKLFLFIGGKGQDNTEFVELQGGYNGGGAANPDRGSGGGSTDLREKISDFSSRILVAGAGSAGHRYRSGYAAKDGGNGGGLLGEMGELQATSKTCVGAQNGCINGNFADSYLGGFGFGNASPGGGGSGYWGGGSGSWSGSSGGSSYYNGTASFKVIKPSTISGLNEGNGFAIITDMYYKSAYKHRVKLSYVFIFLIC